MKIVFMGTPQFAVPSLEGLLAKHEVVAVVTQPDKPKGRGKKIQYSPIKQLAIEKNIPIYQPERIRQIIPELAQYQADIFVVVAYGQLLPKDVLDIPKFGCINVHGSLLPKYRGSAPINWAVLNGETTTGVTIMYLDEGMDSGDMILKMEQPINAEDTSATLYEALSVLGKKALLDAIDLIQSDKYQRIPQDNDQATYAPMLSKELGLIDWSKSANEIANLVRGLNPWPCAYTFYKTSIMKIWQATVSKTACNDVADYGTILSVDKGSIAVKTGDGVLLLQEIQMQGGKCLKVADFLRGNKIYAGEKFNTVK